jgi:tetratricopeptide (TPR) repeat protein
MIGGNFEQAIQALAYNYRSSIYEKLGNYKQAIADFSLAILIDPHYSSAYNNRGSANVYTQRPTTTRTVPSSVTSSSSRLKPCSCIVAIKVL